MSEIVSITTWEDAEEKAIEVYQTVDQHGNSIQINPKNPDNHTGAILDNEKTLFYNLDLVVNNPHNTTIYSGGGSPRTQANAQKGQIVTYSRDNLIKELNIPRWSDNIRDHTVEVVVLYTDNATHNYTLTYGVRLNYDD